MLLSSLLAAYQGYWTTGEGENEVEHYDYPDVWTSFAQESLMNVFLYAAIALVVILLAVGIFVRYKRQESLASYTRTAMALAVGFAVTVIVTMLSLEFFDMAEKGYIFDIVLWPSVVCAIVLVLSAAAVYVASLFSKKAMRITGIAAGSLSGAALICVIVCLIVYYASGDAEGNNGVTVTSTESLAMYLCALGLIAVIAVLAFVCGRKDKKGFDSKSISYAAVCIALSFALSYISPIHMPQGGSVTIGSLVPLMIYSYMFGTKKGVFAGFVYGLLQIIQDPWLIHPAQMLLDYPIAFAAIGLSGMFAHIKKLEKLPQLQIALGGIVASVLRFAAHLFSGVFAFSYLAPDVDAWIYSLGYNATYVFPDIAIAIAVCIIVFSSKAFMKQVKKFSAPAKTDAPVSEGEAQSAPSGMTVSETAAADDRAAMSGTPDQKA